jgi:hypothetical protein
MKKLISFSIFLFCIFMLRAQSKEDSIQIMQTGLNYMEGWYTADTFRMNKALHPELIKRRVLAEQGNKINQLDKATMMEKTKTHKVVPVNEQGVKITILDIFGTIASIKAESNGFYDYLHLVKIDGQWFILNALWDKKNKK